MEKINYEKIEEIVSELKLEEKVAMVHAAGLFRNGSVERLGIPSLYMSDGPMGVRNEFPNESWMPVGNTDDYVTYLPSISALACTWNRKLAYESGDILGKEARGRGKDIILAPGINIVRSPLGGRNFEYMSEDPYLTAQLAVPYIKGVQENDVAACVKHFAVNSQETERLNVDVVINERAVREIYLPAFEAAVKEGNSYSIMSAYNKLWGLHCSHNKWLLRDVLEKEWGYDGVLVSDWSAISDTKLAAEAGMDIEMSVTDNFDEYFFANPLINAVREGQVKEELIDEKVRKILKLMYRLNMFSEDRKSGEYNSFESREKTLDIAREAVVLLKNEENILPLSKKVKKVAVIGQNANIRHSEGGGSAEVKSLYEVTPLMGIKMILGGNAEVSYAKGYTNNLIERESINLEAIELAKNSDVVIFVGGLKHTKEDFSLFQNALQSSKESDTVVNIDSEGNDKTDMKLPYEQDEIINSLLEVNPNTVIVITTGSPVDMSDWAEKSKALVNVSYNGMEGGRALAEVLFGDVNPSGKLTVTMPKKLEDSPAHSIGEFPGGKQVRYNEGIFVGYRYFTSYDIEPQFAFGHGLSYTEFKYDDINVEVIEKNDEINAKVSFKLKNTGKREGSEIAQIYVNDIESSIKRPSVELKGFEKISLFPGESKKVTINLDKKSFAFYSEEEKSWVVEPGGFNILVGSSCVKINLKERINIKAKYKF
ncbi:glycoside hydrolase family 3 C-terminal domain-containing protein [Clostridium sp. D53t1_180928_C8]|uniref:beta-glucosidase n=1 Tax=Clostridium sp. D53t1_180928_C8 TaxID=2787101 RepID=UPI0018AA46EA|nr:glycoside hydrolase family 3 C-terminal domain-containing protein [Clostridium sp. D53t1_180928_C8]